MDVRWGSIDKGVVEQWTELTNLLARHDRTEEYYSAEDLAEELEEHGFDPELDSWSVWAGDDMVGFGQMRVSQALAEGRVKAFLTGGVHPDHRGRGIGRELFERFEARALVKAAELFPGVEVMLRAPGGVDGSPGESVRPLLARRGYEIGRYFNSLERELPGEPIDAVGGAQAFTPEVNESTRLAYNDAFSTHWGSAPATPELWADHTTSRTFRPSTSFVCLGDSGEVEAFCLTDQFIDGELYVDIVGTRQAARGRGLARACLTATIRQAAAEGYRKVGLGVDAANPDGALGLYESTGFVKVRSYTSHQKAVPALQLQV